VLADCGLPFQLTGSTYRVGVSIGLQLIDRPTDPDRVLSAADAALYRAKSAGGNRIATNQGPRSAP
jgi:GGDEF domain-containing protein